MVGPRHRLQRGARAALHVRLPRVRLGVHAEFPVGRLAGEGQPVVRAGEWRLAGLVNHVPALAPRLSGSSARRGGSEEAPRRAHLQLTYKKLTHTDMCVYVCVCAKETTKALRSDLHQHTEYGEWASPTAVGYQYIYAFILLGQSQLNKGFALF